MRVPPPLQQRQGRLGARQLLRGHSSSSFTGSVGSRSSGGTSAHTKMFGDLAMATVTAQIQQRSTARFAAFASTFGNAKSKLPVVVPTCADDARDPGCQWPPTLLADARSRAGAAHSDGGDNDDGGSGRNERRDGGSKGAMVHW